MPEKMLNILVVSGGGFQGSAILAGIQASCFQSCARIILCDSNQKCINQTFAHCFFRVPLVKDKKHFIQTVKNICIEQQIHIVIPSTIYEVFVLNEMRSFFLENKIQLTLPETAVMNLFTDKVKTEEFLRQSKLPYVALLDPRYDFPEYPVITKKRRGWGGSGFSIIENQQEKDRFYRNNAVDEYVFQRQIKNFREYSVDFSIGLNRTVSNWLIRERIQTSGGFAIYGRKVNNHAVKKVASSFIDSINKMHSVGLWNIQLFETDGGVLLSDINPRIGTSSPLSIKMGVNIVEHLLKSGFEDRIDPTEYDSHRVQQSRTVIRTLKEMDITPYDSRKIDTLIFDLDDTLIQHKLWLFWKLELFLKHLDQHTKMSDEWKWQIVEEANPAYLVDEVFKHINPPSSDRTPYYNLWRKLKPKGNPLFPGVKGILTELRSRNYKLGLLTDNPPETQLQKIEAGNLEGLFDHILFTRACGAEKPDLKGFHSILKSLESRPDQTIMIGDNLFRDIAGAKRANYSDAILLTTHESICAYSKHTKKTMQNKLNGFKEISSLHELLFLFPEKPAPGNH